MLLKHLYNLLDGGGKPTETGCADEEIDDHCACVVDVPGLASVADEGEEDEGVDGVEEEDHADDGDLADGRAEVSLQFSKIENLTLLLPNLPRLPNFK